MVVHTGIQTLLSLSCHGVGGHGDNWQVRQAQRLPDMTGGAQAVHDRHLHVHQHHVIHRVGGRHQRDRILAVIGGLYQGALFLQ